jgi:hypothetical protein
VLSKDADLLLPACANHTNFGQELATHRGGTKHTSLPPPLTQGAAAQSSSGGAVRRADDRWEEGMVLGRYNTPRKPPVATSMGIRNTGALALPRNTHPPSSHPPLTACVATSDTSVCVQASIGGSAALLREQPKEGTVVPTAARSCLRSWQRARPTTAPHMSLNERALLIQTALTRPGAIDAGPGSRTEMIRRFACMRPSTANTPARLRSSSVHLPNPPVLHAATAGQLQTHGTATRTVPAWLQAIELQAPVAAPLRLPVLLRTIDALLQEHAALCVAQACQGHPPCELHEALLQHFERHFGRLECSRLCLEHVAALVVSVHMHATSCDAVRAFGLALGIVCGAPGRRMHALARESSEQQALASTSLLEVSSSVGRRPTASTPNNRGQGSFLSNYISVVTGMGGRQHACPVAEQGNTARRCRRVFPSHIPPAAVVHPSIDSITTAALALPGMAALVAHIQEGGFLSPLQGVDLGVEVTAGHAATLDLLLLEASKLLNITETPTLFVKAAPLPQAHFLSLPVTSGVQDTSATTWRQRPVVVVTSAALSILTPWELQALLAGALCPQIAPAGGGFDAAQPLSSPPRLPLRVLATAVALSELAPHIAQAALPRHCETMWTRCLLPMLRRAGDMLQLCSDRCALLVAQVRLAWSKDRVHTGTLSLEHPLTPDRSSIRCTLGVGGACLTCRTP